MVEVFRAEVDGVDLAMTRVKLLDTEAMLGNSKDVCCTLDDTVLREVCLFAVVEGLMETSCL